MKIDVKGKNTKLQISLMLTTRSGFYESETCFLEVCRIHYLTHNYLAVMQENRQEQLSL